MAEEGQEDYLKELELAYNIFKDGLNLGFESLKHLTTLNAGSIVLIATFLRDIFPHQISLGLKFLVAGSFILFGLSLASAAFLIYFLMHARHKLEDLLTEELLTVKLFGVVSLEFSGEDITEAARSTEPASPRNRQEGKFPDIIKGLQHAVARWRTLFSWVVVPFLLFFSGLASFGTAVILNLF
jgi:hypothetical protein